ncbi:MULTISPECIES: SDR family NAD(P)-dependent oxidoreductase [Oceanospirillaceae]|uniref:SDR family NAD(P)-dependent oxidoreductase n=1 Tax=Oceanobacter antarcticus TaxID=3133425 RepID=A0ABW8NF46_9GAMM
MDSTLFDLTGKVALVTGAGGGLGNAISNGLAAHGATVIVSDIDLTVCDAVADSIRRQGGIAHALGCDLADPVAINQLVTDALALCGRVDVLVCNAGIQGPAGSLAAVSDDDWEQVMNINLRSAQRLTALLIPAMAERGDGSVILMASIAALRGNKAIGLYGLSKAALAQLARNLTVEWGPSGVRVNAIAPGLIRTPLATALIDNRAFMERRLAATPLRRVGEPEEIAGVVIMLASRAGGFIAGQTLVVDGGTLISDGG